MDSVEIKNRVAASGLVSLDLKTYLPDPGEVIGFDLKPLLFKGLILKEKDFRQSLKSMDWSGFEGKHLAIFCSTEAIIPLWAYMLVATYAEPLCASLFFGTPESLTRSLLLERIRTADPEEFEGKKIVVKGCGDERIGAEAYMAITARLRPHAASIMYGEPCSTVPIYKKPRIR